MRIFVIFESIRLAVDAQPEADVKYIKDAVESELLEDTLDDKKEEKVRDLIYGGASLHDDWILQDVGINSGATLKCELRLQKKANLIVQLGYVDETLDIMDDIDPVATPISKIRSIISKQLGLPVSAYRLCLVNPSRDLPKKMGRAVTEKAVELFDCNTMECYGLEIGATVKLEVWDGWAEFVRAALRGDKDLVRQYLSHSVPEKHFQRRVALFIAAHFNYTSLAHFMLKRRTRPDNPVGSHPTREWCSSSEHVETKKCAVHEACEQGNVDVLRMMMKASVLSFVARDGQGRTPWEIVVGHFHKDCFEYLLARQWGRKSGKDNVSLPLLIYCRVMLWCERARNRVFVMQGASKSTLRGQPTRTGALVGSGIAVDGLGNKTMSSIPFSAMPKPNVQPKKVLPALAKARRRFRRQKSSVVFSTANRRRSTVSWQSSSGMSQGRNSASTVISERSSNGMSQVFASDDTLSAGKPQRPNMRKRERESFKQANDTESVKSDWDGKDFLPPIGNRQKAKPAGIQGASSTAYDTFKSFKTRTTSSPKERDFPNLLAPSYDSQIVTINGTKVKRIPLPFSSIPEFRKPYTYLGDKEDPVEITLTRFESYRGCSARENAIKCLTLADTFSKKPWLKRANLAACLARRGVTKSTALIS